jgi:hypothetical protein
VRIVTFLLVRKRRLVVFHTDQTRVPPLNTGKVRIGAAYIPPQAPWSPSRDAYDLQSALLARPGVRLPFWSRLYAYLFREAV